MSEPTPQRSSRHQAMHDFRWPAALVLLAVLALVAYWITLRTTTEILEKGGDAAARIADRFRSGTITTTFVSALPQLTAFPGGNLELASLKVTETFSRTDERKVFWDMFSLGETVTEIRVPVTYRYHLRLNDSWQLDVKDQTCIVRAPAIRPSLPPAIHTDAMERHVDQGWLRFGAARQMEELERSITPTLERSAADPRRLELIREASRRTVAEFVRNWLIKEGQWRADGLRSIVVVFPDEDSRANEIGPALRLEK